MPASLSRTRSASANCCKALWIAAGAEGLSRSWCATCRRTGVVRVGVIDRWTQVNLANLLRSDIHEEASVKTKEQDEYGTSQTSIRHHPQQRSAHRPFDTSVDVAGARHTASRIAFGGADRSSSAAWFAPSGSCRPDRYSSSLQQGAVPRHRQGARD